MGLTVFRNSQRLQFSGKLGHMDDTLDKRVEPAWIKALMRYFPVKPFEAVEAMLSTERLRKIDEVIAERTITIIPVLEKFYDKGNVSAVLRSAESLGYQQVHVIRNEGRIKSSRRVTQGAEKWLDIVRWRSTTDCLVHLKSKGYRIAVTCAENSVPIHELDVSKPLALLFGAELEGVSEEALELADVRCHIPMRGFTQSFNVSVAAAIALYEIGRMRDELGSHGDLRREEQDLLRKYYHVLSTSFKDGLHRSSGICR